MLTHKCMIHVKLGGYCECFYLPVPELSTPLVHLNLETLSYIQGTNRPSQWHWAGQTENDVKQNEENSIDGNKLKVIMCAYLWFITPVDIEFPLKALQSETKTPPPSLSRSLHNLFASLAELPQTFTLSKAHLGLKVQEVQENLRPKNQLKWTILDTETQCLFWFQDIP